MSFTSSLVSREGALESWRGAWLFLATNRGSGPSLRSRGHTLAETLLSLGGMRRSRARVHLKEIMTSSNTDNMKRRMEMTNRSSLKRPRARCSQTRPETASEQSHGSPTERKSTQVPIFLVRHDTWHAARERGDSQPSALSAACRWEAPEGRETHTDRLRRDGWFSSRRRRPRRRSSRMRPHKHGERGREQEGAERGRGRGGEGEIFGWRWGGITRHSHSGGFEELRLWTAGCHCPTGTEAGGGLAVDI